MAQPLAHCLNEVLGEIAVRVKMLVNHSWTKRPREALLQLDIELGIYLFRIGGSLRASVRYHPCIFLFLTRLMTGTVSGG